MVALCLGREARGEAYADVSVCPQNDVVSISNHTRTNREWSGDIYTYRPTYTDSNRGVGCE